MADNVTVTEGSGKTIASDDVGGVQHQRVKLSLGADGAATDALGGAGGVAAGVQRVTLASDDPAVVSLGVIDDWDETDRCKVNPIAGQAGVAAGAGVNGTTVQRVTIATDDQTAANLNNALKGEYETVAASQTAQVLGGAGAAGDYLARVIIVPATTSPGSVAILDNATSITIFAGGAASLTELKPIVVDLGMTSVSGAWKVTTGADVSVVAVGNFSA